MTTTNYSYEIIDANELTAIDLWNEARHNHGERICARVRIDDHAEQSNVLFFPGVGRAGIAWGADAYWTDCASIEECIERYLSDTMIS